MDVNLILPKTSVRILDNESVYYLAGPIRGADDWQAKAIQMLGDVDPGCYVVCPCRYDDTHPLWKYRVEDDGIEEFERQVLWERRYMMIAANRGCLIFWLPSESKTNPRPAGQGPYAQDTYGEIGRYSAIVSARGDYCIPLNMVVGADDDFPGLDVIKVNLDQDFGCNYSVYRSLYETIVAAVNRARRI